MITRFDAIPIGARFEFRGRRYEKLAFTLAGDEERCGNHFHGATEVVCATPAPAPAPPSRLAHRPQIHHRVWIDPK